MATTKGRPDEPGVSARRPENYGEIRVQIATELVKLHSEYYGKGPTQARTYMWDDLVAVVLRGGLTTVERTTGRDVQSYMSQIHAAQGVAVELFILEPDAGVELAD